MTKSIQPQLATAPKTPQSKSSNSSPGTKKKSLFSLFSSKNVIKSSKDGLDKTLNSALVAAGMPGLILASSVPLASPSLTPALAVQVAPISPDIFSANVSRKQSEILLPEVGDPIKETAQLLFCARLLVDVSVSSSTSTVTKPNEEQLKWIREMESQPLEREHLYQLMDRMVDRFIEQPTKRSESICEIVLLGPVLGEESYQWLLRCFLAEFDKVPTLTIGLLQGLVQLIQDAPVGYLHADDLILILRIIRWRLEDSAQQFEGYSVHLTLAISKVLDVMASQRIQGLNRVQEHKPLLDVLSGLKTSKDPFLQYQAHYAFQALQWVPDETQLQRSLRHFAGMANSLAEISAVMRLDFKEFLEGLQEVQKIVKDTYDAVKAGWESVPALIEDGRGLFESLKEGFGSGHKHPWYITLRGAISLVQEGQLADLNRLICEAPCRQHPLFQWGICELLGEIAVDPLWNVTTRGQAIKFLGVMYRTMEGSNLHLDTRKWVLTVLYHISDLPVTDLSTGIDNKALKTEARNLTQALQKDGVVAPPFLYPLRICLPLPRSSLLLNEVNDSPDLELVLHRLRRQQCNEYNKQNRRAVYIQPLSKMSLQASEDNLVPLHARVRDFLKSKAEVMLIMGDSGAGKSTFSRRLEYDYWEKYEAGDPIPLFIDLKAIDNPDKDMIQQQLDDLKVFSPWHIGQLRSRQFILICDGYDERRSWSNLHGNNKFNKPSHWKAKMIITCRTQYLKPNYKIYFEPLTNCSTTYSLYEEAVIAPFKQEQIKEYINQFTLLHETHELIDNRPVWNTEQYLERLKGISSLRELVRSPFMLKIVLDTLPRIAITTTQMTQAELYDEFVEFHFEYEQRRLSRQMCTGNMVSEISAAFASVEDDFIVRGIDFSMQLANSIFKEQDGKNSIEPPASTDERTWKTEFFRPDAMTKLMLESSPVVCRASLQQGGRRLVHSRNQRTSKKNSYEFSHRSILEYLYSRLIYDPSCDPPYKTLSACPVSSTSLSSLVSHPLSQRNLTVEPLILDFLADRVQHGLGFKEHLQRVVMLSKTVPQASQASANAITILVRAGVQFNGADLRGIHIPEADISHGVFDSVQLQGADLREVDLRNTWLRQANLSGALMKGVRFYELPFLVAQSAVRSCAYSLDGEILAIGLQNGNISAYDTFSWKKVWTFSGHEGRVCSLVYSPREGQFASGGSDSTIRLWDSETGECIRTLSGHSEEVTSVAYSPSGNQLASGSKDGTVRLWHVETGACNTLIGHWKAITSVVYSLRGNHIASGSDDHTVRLWDVETGSCLHSLSGHTGLVTSVASSPKGDQLASGSHDKTVRLWNADTGAPLLTLRGHSQDVNSVAYLPKPHRNVSQIASGSDDGTVRLWDAEAGNCLRILSGHREWIYSVVYSPSGNRLASGSQDKTVRLWDVETVVSPRTLRGHTDEVTFVAYLQKCDQNGSLIASTSNDKTVRLWDVETGACHHTLSTHTAATAVVYSPKGDQIAIHCKDRTVRMWNAEAGTPYQHSSDRVDGITSVAYSRTGDQIAFGRDDGTVQLWEIEAGASLHTLSGHEKPISSVVYSPKGDQIASGSLDSTVRLWDANTGECRHILSGHDASVSNLVYSPEGGRIASTSTDKTVRLWDVESGDCCYILRGHGDAIKSVVYSPNGIQIASGSRDGKVQLWDVVTGASLYTLRGHKEGVTSIEYSPKGDQIASGSWDYTVRLWDVETRQCQLVISEFNGDVNSIIWTKTPGDHCLVTGCQDGSVRKWRIIQEIHGLKALLCWSSSHTALTASGASVQDVRNLSQVNTDLLLQRGAVGEPSTSSSMESAAKI